MSDEKRSERYEAGMASPAKGPGRCPCGSGERADRRARCGFPDLHHRRSLGLGLVAPEFYVARALHRDHRAARRTRAGRRGRDARPRHRQYGRQQGGYPGSPDACGGLCRRACRQPRLQDRQEGLCRDGSGQPERRKLEEQTMSDEGSYYQRDRSWHPPRLYAGLQDLGAALSAISAAVARQHHLGDDRPGLRPQQSSVRSTTI